MFNLKDATWVISLGTEIRNKVKSHLKEILKGVLAPQFSQGVIGSITIIVGSPVNSDVIKKMAADGFIDLNGLAGDDHIIKNTVIDGKPFLLIAGCTDEAAAYGVFSFLEEIGFSFLASGIIPPSDQYEIVIPEIGRTYKTESKWRGMFVSFCMVSTSIMSVSDFRELFKNMFRMKLNRIVFYPFENEPIIDYTFKGERKVVGDISRPESGYFSYGRHWTGSFNVDEISVGRDKFYPRKRVAPLEFQEVSGSDEALDMGKEFMNAIIEEADKNNIGVWLAFLPQFVSMNMTKHIKTMPRKNLHWSALVSCTDPAVREINAVRIGNIVDSYPGLQGLFIGIPEGFYEDPYIESQKYINSQLPEFADALSLLKKYWGDHWPGDELQQKHIEADIAFSKIALDALEEAKKYKHDIKLGLITVCKAYLLTKLDKIIPKDVAFCDIESRSLWTHGGAPLFLFKEMRERECSIIPRITDDGSQAGMQFNLNLYHRDGYCRSAQENFTDGFMMQTLFIKGADHNIKYLSDGLWNPNMNPDDFYKSFLPKLYGAKAYEKIRTAYDILEINEEFMGGRGAANMPWNHVPPEISVMRSFRDFSNKFHACPLENDFLVNSEGRANIYKKTIEHLYKAADLFDTAMADCKKSGLEECQYMRTRTMAYAVHLETMVILSDIYKLYSHAFTDSNIENNFKNILSECQRAKDSAVKTAQLFSDCVVHTTDLSPLWMINSSMIKGTEVLFKYIQNILAFYRGGEYWLNEGWDRLFGHCPYPAHGIEVLKLQDLGSDEPG